MHLNLSLLEFYLPSPGYGQRRILHTLEGHIQLLASKSWPPVTFMLVRGLSPTLLWLNFSS